MNIADITVDFTNKPKIIHIENSTRFYECELTLVQSCGKLCWHVNFGQKYAFYNKTYSEVTAAIRLKISQLRGGDVPYLGIFNHFTDEAIQIGEKIEFFKAIPFNKKHWELAVQNKLPYGQRVLHSRFN